jgi:hypothetical protein
VREELPLPEITNHDMEAVLAGLQADMGDPSRIEIDRIDADIAQLQHHHDYVAESYELALIQAEIRDLEAIKTGLLERRQPEFMWPEPRLKRWGRKIISFFPEPIIPPLEVSHEPGWEADAKALRGDWEVISKDFKKVFGRAIGRPK